MRPHSLIDAHVHLWDPRRLRYPWLDDNMVLNRPYLLDDYRAATQCLPIEAMVFVQCEAEPPAFLDEAAWVAGLLEDEPRIKGLVAWAPLENGRAVRGDLERLSRYSILRGIRRIIQFEPDPDFCLRPGFLDGVRTLAEFNLSFDICVSFRQMPQVVRFAAAVPEVPMMLDHLGKPPIRDGSTQPWADQLRDLARLPHVSCKISGVATEADRERWSVDDLKRYIDIAIDAFGFNRIVFGSDWPVAVQAIRFDRWIEVLEDVLAGVGEIERRNFWHDNAMHFYRLEH